MKKTLSIKVGTIEESLARFSAAWKKAEQGKATGQPIETLHFENTHLLLKTLTPRRLKQVLR